MVMLKFKQALGIVPAKVAANAVIILVTVRPLQPVMS
jgi:hypothetical protein